MKRRESHGKNLTFQRKSDPYLDRRSGDDRRKVYSLSYFSRGNKDRRISYERRFNFERRGNCVRVSKWSSVCFDKDEFKDL